MTEAELTRRIATHNRVNLAVGIAIIPAALLLWYLSWVLLPRFFSWPYDVFFVEWYHGAPPQRYAIWLTWVALALLLCDALRRLAPHFGRGEFSQDSGSDSSFQLGQTKISYARPMGDQGSLFYWVYLLLACAPRATAAGADFMAARIPCTPATINQATVTLKALRKANQWQPVSLYKDAAEGVNLLVGMRLAWLRTNQGEVEIRYPPAGE